MKIYVVCDLEGTAGVVDMHQQCWFDGKGYLQARKLATLELNALVEGALAGGATEIHAWDGHGNFPGGLDIELLHPACKLIMNAGAGGPLGIDRSFDALFLCGLHGMAGAERGVLSHSFDPHTAAVWLNDVKIGEIGMCFAHFARYGIPAVFIAGDWAAGEEAKALAPGIVVAVVKEGLNTVYPPFSAPAVAVSLAPEKARAVIREGARQAMGKIGQIAPVHFAPPFVLRTQFLEAKYADEAAKRAGVRRIDEVTIEAVQDEL